MRPRSWLRFWYDVLRLVYVLLFAPTFTMCVAMIFTWSLFRFATSITWTVMNRLWLQLNTIEES